MTPVVPVNETQEIQVKSLKTHDKNAEYLNGVGEHHVYMIEPL
jgi:hypothetical protein